jgi:CheY-like chemotaxis protein
MEAERAAALPLILVVDDCASLREGCALACRAAGYPTIEAGTANEALQQAVRHRPGIVILDLMLPGIPGWDVATLLKRDPRTRGTRIVMMSGSIDSIAIACTRDAEAVLKKPFDVAELLASVKRITAAAGALSAAPAGVSR